MTKYSVSVFVDNSWEGIALFADSVAFDAMIDFCVRQYENTASADNIAITDLETGEVLWDYAHDFEPEWPDDVDETGFNPYEGCYDYDC